MRVLHCSEPAPPTPCPTLHSPLLTGVAVLCSISSRCLLSLQSRRMPSLAALLHPLPGIFQRCSRCCLVRPLIAAKEGQDRVDVLVVSHPRSLDQNLPCHVHSNQAQTRHLCQSGEGGHLRAPQRQSARTRPAAFPCVPLPPRCCPGTPGSTRHRSRGETSAGRSA